jgi:hypothetical protein
MSSNLATIDKTLTMADLCGPLLNGRHLVLDLSQLFLEGVLGLPGSCKIQGRKLKQQQIAMCTELI